LEAAALAQVVLALAKAEAPEDLIVQLDCLYLMEITL
jgi:hypothetical protein